MARRRGFLAELQHQHRLAAQRQAQQQRLAIREHNRAVAEMQRAARERERAEQAAHRAAVADRARLEREAKGAYVAAREAEAAERTAQAVAELEEVEGLLAATLEVDDWVDLALLRQSVEPAPFAPPREMLVPAPSPHYHPLPTQPPLTLPAAPTGLGAALGGNRRHQADVATARDHHQVSMAAWWQQTYAALEQNAGIRARWREQERQRFQMFERAQNAHEVAEEQRMKDARASNEDLDRLITGLRDRRGDALEEYVAIVLANSTYPSCYPVEYEHAFHAADRELSVTVVGPSPESFPSVKSVRYVKASDELAETRLSATEVKRRYNDAIRQVALRTVHEVFEADREAIVDAISLTIVVNAVDPATGHDTSIPVLQLAVERKSVMSLDLSRVDVAEALKHLSAAVSKNPFGLVPLAGEGVRG